MNLENFSLWISIIALVMLYITAAVDIKKLLFIDQEIKEKYYGVNFTRTRKILIRISAIFWPIYLIYFLAYTGISYFKDMLYDFFKD